LKLEHFHAQHSTASINEINCPKPLDVDLINAAGDNFNISGLISQPTFENGRYTTQEDKLSPFKVALGNLPEEDIKVTRSALKRVFGEFGKINRIWINPINKLYGFLEFEDQGCAEEAAKRMVGTQLFGNIIEVDKPTALIKSNDYQPSTINKTHESAATLKDLRTENAIKLKEINYLRTEASSRIVESQLNELPLNEKKKIISSLMLIVDSQKQAVLKYSVKSKGLEDKIEQLETTYNANATKLTSKGNCLRAISNDMKQRIEKIRRENSSR
jgi:RNA recognition motif-containing protein